MVDGGSMGVGRPYTYNKKRQACVKTDSQKIRQPGHQALKMFAR
jgi:hypothetical protein